MRASAGANKPESKRGLLGNAAAGALSMVRQHGDEAADALSAGAIRYRHVRVRASCENPCSAACSHKRQRQ